MWLFQQNDSKCDVIYEYENMVNANRVFSSELSVFKININHWIVGVKHLL